MKRAIVEYIGRFDSLHKMLLRSYKICVFLVKFVFDYEISSVLDVWSRKKQTLWSSDVP